MKGGKPCPKCWQTVNAFGYPLLGMSQSIGGYCGESPSLGCSDMALRAGANQRNCQHHERCDDPFAAYVGLVRARV